ncbi:MAG: hypothetical protein ACE5ES_06330, partial [Candidatus Nanoarchaeia archaeon]
GFSLVAAHTGDGLYDHHSMMGGMMGSYGYGWMIFGWIIWILVIITLILFIVWLAKQLTKPPSKRRK